MKQHILFIFFAFFTAGCATREAGMQISGSDFYTMKTDMFPKDISRAEYYEQMAIAYSHENQIENAIENFRLSILHDPKRVSAYLNLSDEYRKTNRNHLALLELGEALKVEPNNTSILRKMGDLYLSTKIYSKAREVYQKMLMLDKKFEEAQWALFYIFKIEKKYTDALGVLVQINKNQNNDYKIAYEKAMLYKLTKEDDLYASNLELAYSLNSNNREIILEYAANSYAQKRFKDSTYALTKFSDTHEFDLEISQNLSYSAVQSENYDVAMREYNKQRLQVTDVNLIDLKKAHVYYLMGDLDGAKKLYSSLLRHQENEEARFYLAQIYITQDKSEDAASVLNKIPTSSDYYGEAQVRLAQHYKYMGLRDDAINIIRTAFAERPDLLVIYKTYADFMIESSQYVETEALLEKGIKLFPKDEDLRLKMAYLYYRLDDQIGFKKQIIEALKMNPQNAAAYSMLAELWYLKNKKADETIYFAKRALELKSTNKNIKPLLAWALMQQNNSTEAVALFEEFFEENPKESFFARSLAMVYSKGEVKEKSQKLTKLANELESNDSLRSRFVFKTQIQQVPTEDLKPSPARIPAGLENK